MGIVGKYHFGPFEMDTRAHQLSKGGTKLKLRGQPYLILEVLVARPGEVVTREEIREKLWPADTFVDFEHGLNTSVKNLRQVLCDSAGRPRYIETVPRFGYRFIAPVEVIAERTDSPLVTPVLGSTLVPPFAAQPASLPPHSSSGRMPRLMWFSSATVLLGGMMLIALLAWPKVRMRWLTGSSKLAESASSTTKRFSSIAVLPLENLSNDPAQEYFADGMTDELTTDIAQLGSLRVISRTSAMHYKGLRKTAPQIGQELGVDALVEGTVERIGDRVRIRIQLIDSARDRHLWASSYDHDIKDVLLLESTAARNVAEEIQGRVAESPADSSSGKSRAVQPQAYELYLRGRYFWSQRSSDGLKKGIECFEQAIAKDHTFAAAYAGLAQSYAIMGSDAMPAGIARARARAAATKALELDPTIPEGHAALGLVDFYYEWKWKEAEQEFRRAIELNPSYSPAHQWYSYYLRAMGRFHDALEEAKHAQQLDPLSLAVNVTLAGRYRDLGQYDQAIETVQRTLELDPNFGLGHELMASVYEQQGNMQLAIGEWQKAVALAHDNPSILAALAHAYAVSGDRAAARRIEKQLVSSKQYIPAWDMAVLCAGLGDRDGAFSWLEKSFHNRESQVPFLNQDRRLNPLQADPRFHALARRIGLPS
jgi:TolB-like protein/DNA-binding winged helix-turn-helix (wHTH) protein/tetratricopeptide (TPR) repeat protein